MGRLDRVAALVAHLAGLLVLTAQAATPPSTDAQALEPAKAAIRARDYGTAARALSEQAARGNPDAQYLLGTLVLADLGGHRPEAAQRPQESAIRLLGPTHVPRTAPSARPQRIEPAVIADPVGRVPFDRVATSIAERRPGIETARPARHHGGDQRTALVDGRGGGLTQQMGDGRIDRRQHGGGQPASERDRTGRVGGVTHIGHARA